MKKRYIYFPFKSLLIFLSFFIYSNLITAQALLTGNVIDNSSVSNFDLTTPNYEDWAIWGIGTETNLSPSTRKNGAAGISDLTATTNGFNLRGLGQFNINHKFTFTDGLPPHNSGTNQSCGLQVETPTSDGVGLGFAFTVPASTEERQIIIYTAHHNAVMELTAELSDGSAPGITLTASISGNNVPAIYTINYKSNSANQTLNLDLELSANSGTNPNPQIYAVTVQNLEPLPVELISFTSERTGMDCLLNWETATEEQNKGFEIENSLDGQSWENIGFVQGSGTTSKINYYSFVDRNPSQGTNYYRLKQIDFDDHFEYSDVQSVLFESIGKSPVSIFPNPSIGHFTLNVNNPHGHNTSIKLMDSRGRLVFSESLSGSNVLVNWKRDFHLSHGQVYFTVIQIGEEIYSERIYINDAR